MQNEMIVTIIWNAHEGLNCKAACGGQLQDVFQVRTSVKKDSIFPSIFLLLSVDWMMRTTISKEEHGIR